MIPSRFLGSGTSLPASHELTVLCHTVGHQRSSVVTVQARSNSPAAISVVVGSVAVRVHTIDALHCYVQAWGHAERLRAVLDPPATIIDPGRD